MKTKRTGRGFSQTFVLLLLVSALPLAATEASRSFQWLSDSGRQIDGLYVLSIREHGMVSRVLAETPSGPVVLTGILNPITGVALTRFLDPQTGWWAELAIVDDLEATNLQDYFRRATREHVPDAHVAIELKLTTSTGFQFSETLDLKDPGELFQEFSRSLAQRVPAERLLDQIPAETVGSILFVAEWLSPQSLATHNENFAHGLRPVVEVVAPLVRGRPDTVPRGGGEAAWDLTVGPMTTGLLSTDADARAEQLKLLSKFAKVENTDPLSDLRDHPSLQPNGSRPR